MPYCKPSGFVMVLMFSSCSAPMPNGGADNRNAGQPGPPEEVVVEREPIPLDCDLRGVPCALADVPLEILQRSEALSDELVDRLANGMTLSEACDWAKTQDGVIEAESNRVAMRFCVEGGRDVWIMTAEGVAIASEEPRVESALPRDPVVPVRAASGIVGENPRRKSALVLAPFAYEFGPLEEGRDVAAILGGTLGYEGNVIYLENATPASTTVGIQNFLGWDLFDIIHVSSHGSTTCNAAGDCTTFIYTGDSYETAEELAALTQKGLNTARVVGDQRQLLGLSPDFFKHHYKNGLSNSVVYFGACQTLGIGDNGFVDALTGTHSVYLGWSEVVRSDHSQDAAVALYTLASADGVVLSEAWQALGPLQVSSHVYQSRPVMAQLLLAVPDRDIRVREVITLQDVDSGEPLIDGDGIAIDGAPGDGLIDAYAYRVQVDGVNPDGAHLAIVQISVNGIAGTPITVASGTPINASSWRVTGEVSLGEDAIIGQSIALHAWVELPEGGTSEHAVTAVVREDVEAWEGQTHVTTFGVLTDMTVTATATVRFELDTESRGIKRFKIDDGTMTWTLQGSVPQLGGGRCPYMLGPLDVPIVHEQGNRLTIDTTTTPATYTGFGNTIGGEVVAAMNCGDYSFTTRPRTVWLYTVDAGTLTVSQDGNTITGSNENANGLWDWSFTRRAGSETAN